MSIRVPGKAFDAALSLLLYDETLTAAGNFDITGIPPSHNRMRIFLWGRGDVTATVDVIQLFFNGDETDANYREGNVSGGSAASNNASDTARCAIVPAASAPANYFSNTEMMILDYSGNKNKQLISFGAERSSAVAILTRLIVTHWENTAPINRITVKSDNDPTDELVAGSRCQIWLYR